MTLLTPRKPVPTIPPNVERHVPATVGELLENLDRRFDHIARLLSLNAPPEVLLCDVVTFGVDGTAQREFQGTYRSVAVFNLTTTTITLNNAPRQEFAPTRGVGMALCPGGDAIVVPIKGNVLSLYGSPGGQVLVTVYTKVVPPSFAGYGGGQASVPSAAAAALTAPDVTVATTPVLAANPLRKGVLIFNEGPDIALLAYAPTATVALYSVQLDLGQYWEMPTPIYLGALSAICAGTTAQLRVTEQS